MTPYHQGTGCRNAAKAADLQLARLQRTLCTCDASSDILLPQARKFSVREAVAERAEMERQAEEVGQDNWRLNTRKPHWGQRRAKADLTPQQKRNKRRGSGRTRPKGALHSTTRRRWAEQNVLV